MSAAMDHPFADPFQDGDGREPGGNADPLVERLALSFGTTLAALRSPERSGKRLMKARRAVYGALLSMGWSFPRIGRAVGRDHASVYYALYPRKSRAKGNP